MAFVIVDMMIHTEADLRRWVGVQLTQVKNKTLICKLVYVLDVGSVGYSLNPVTPFP